MDERDLLARLREVDDVLASVRPRAAHEARLLARLRGEQRAAQRPSPSGPALLAAQRLWRPLCATAALAAALALALALDGRDQEQGPAHASTSRGGEREAPEPLAARLSTAEDPTRPRARVEASRRLPSELEEGSERTAAPPAPEPAPVAAWAAPPPPARPGSDLLDPEPRFSSRDEQPQRSDGRDPTRELRTSSVSGAARAKGAPASSNPDGPGVLWTPGRSEVAPGPGRGHARGGSAAGSRADGCEPAERLLDRARADCEAQALTLSELDLAYVDACGEGRFGGLDYSCGPAADTDLAAKPLSGCTAEQTPEDGTCKAEEDVWLDAIHGCEDAGLTFVELTLSRGGCSDGFQGAHVICCEDEALPMAKGCTNEARESGSDCTE